MPGSPIMRGAAAGTAAAAVWAAQQPLDMRVFGVRYSDTELLAGFVRGSERTGWAMHLANGAAFGAAFGFAAPRLPAHPIAAGLAAAMAEHHATWPLTALVNRHNRRVPKLWGNRRAYWQAVWRHALFGVLLGALYASLDSSSAPE